MRHPVYSDHCLLNLCIKLPFHFQCVYPLLEFETMPLRFKWSEIGQENFTKTQNIPEFTELFNTMLTKEYSNDAVGTASFIQNFNETVHLLASTSLKKSRKPKKIPHKKWFDSECRHSKTNLNRLACNMSKHPYSPEIRQLYFCQRSKHSQLMKQKKLNFLNFCCRK